MKYMVMVPPNPIEDASPTVAAASGPGDSRSARDLQELERENRELRREIASLEAFRTLAYRDALTGLWNRRYFDERFAEELSRARRNPKHGFSVLLVDVNDLKRINDQRGHQAGDEAIAWTAAFLRKVMRGHDVCCRTGGDEFAVILPDVSMNECGAIVQRLRRELEVANTGSEFPMGLSFGTASCPDNGDTASALLNDADVAMYRDKRRQKSRNTPVSETAANTVERSNSHYERADATLTSVPATLAISRPR